MLPIPPSAGTPMLAPTALAGCAIVLCTSFERWPLALAAADELARAGARVAFLSSDRELPATQYPTFTLDEVEVDVLERRLAEIEQHTGPLNGLVHLPPHQPPCPGETLDLAAWRRHTHRTLDLGFLLSSRLAERCQAQGIPGSVVQVVDRAAWSGAPGQVHGAAISAALQTMDKTLAVEWARSDIRVNTIVPGPFAGDDSPAHELAELQGRDLADTLPAQRLGELQEFGWAVAFLCSPYAAYITGATFIIDGGNHLRRSISGPPFLTVAQWLTPER